jgi:hypothetical protein
MDNPFLLAIGWLFALAGILTLLLQVLTVIIRHRRIFDDAPGKRSLFLHVAGMVYLLGGGSIAYLAVHYRRIGVLSLPIEIAALSLSVVGIFMGGTIENEATRLSRLQNAERNTELSRRIAERWQTLRAERRSRQQQ